jgi:hypothetical protein
LECFITYYTWNLHVSERNKKTLLKIFNWWERWHHNNLSLWQSVNISWEINVDIISNSKSTETLIEFEDDISTLTKWFKEKNINIKKEDASDYVNIIKQINTQKDIEILLDGALNNIDGNIKKLIDLLDYTW